MAEFIGTRISLVSNSDIRYVGTLHEINSENSTVALENVSMLGTEGRRPENEVAALDSIYEYILFRGTDVKDLRIEEAPAIKEFKPPQIPNDPAILGSGTHPKNLMRTQNQQHNVSTQGQTQQALLPSQNPQPIQTAGPAYPQQTQYPQFYPPSEWGRSAHIGSSGYATIPYGGPPDWYPGQQQDFIPGSQFAPYSYLTEQTSLITQQQNINNNKPLPIGVSANKKQASATQQIKKGDDPQILPKAEVPAIHNQTAPVPTPAQKESKANSISASSYSSNKQEPPIFVDPIKSTPIGPKTTTRIKPVLPLNNNSIPKESLRTSPENSTKIKKIDPTASLREATKTASAAVAAAMAQLPNTNNSSGMSNEKGSGNQTRNTRKPSLSDSGADKTNRGSHKLHGPRFVVRGALSKVEIPTGDFDFESANAKFSKKDLINEAIAVSPTNANSNESLAEPQIPTTYNKTKSFFDNISSEVKDRQETGNPRPGGREWRSEEQKKNLETFGQESIDNGERGVYRGRGRGRGGYRGRGYNRGQLSRGRASFQSRGNAQIAF
ncbi:putative g2 m phase checkpoint control protein [Golovinomyces cichoracearum]|uniref:Putative g2 m phase checkpoint control protein n=1 Tax=Golovinomyces cichoracearum TaxID=62708 RepID=A0A420J6Q0_9PEZI|nr:putative g2 m phase checkpoint control protein [Golovinomyces cichoracearum]